MSRPEAMATASVTPWTRTGERRRVRVPSPSCPSELSPQDHTWPLPHRAIELSWPAVTAVTGLPAQGTVTWVGRVRLAVSPRPSAPTWLLPHVSTCPDAVRTITCSRPPCTDTTSLSPATAAGFDGDVEVDPLPS